MIDWGSILPVLFIVFVVLFLPMILKAITKGAQKRMEPPPQYEEEEQEFILPTPPPIRESRVTERIVTPDYEFHDHLEEERQLTAIDSRQMENKIHPEFKKEVVSSAFSLKPTAAKKHSAHPLFTRFEKMTPLQKMVVYSEIMQKPWE